MAARGSRRRAAAPACWSAAGCTVEDAYAYSKFARMVLGTNDIDFRARRAQSARRRSSWPPDVAGRPMDVTYADLEKAPAVLLAGFEPEEESPIVFLRLRKAARKQRRCRCSPIAPFATRGLTKMSGTAHPRPRPAARPRRWTGWPTTTLLNQPGAIILVGERLATSPGALSAASRLAAATGARLGWVPRRAGERGALEAGALPNLLPGGRPVADASARAADRHRMARRRPARAAGRDTAGILAAARSRRTGCAADRRRRARRPARPRRGAGRDRRRALRRQPGAAGKRGHRARRRGVPGRAGRSRRPARSSTGRAGFGRSDPSLPSNATPDLRVLYTLADEIGVDLGLPDAATAGEELAELGWWGGTRPSAPSVAAAEAAAARRRARRC